MFRSVNVLIDEYWVPIWINNREACGAGAGFVGLLDDFDPRIHYPLLNAANVLELGERFAVGVPAWVKRHDVLIKHAFE